MPGGDGVNFMFEIPNRGKRSVGLDISTDDGRELLYRLVETADVFVTNYLPDVRERLGIDVDADPSPQPEHHLRARLGPRRTRPEAATRRVRRCVVLGRARAWR